MILSIDDIPATPEHKWPGQYRCVECTLLRCHDSWSTCEECTYNMTIAVNAAIKAHLKNSKGG